MTYILILNRAYDTISGCNHFVWDIPPSAYFWSQSSAWMVRLWTRRLVHLFNVYYLPVLERFILYRCQLCFNRQITRESPSFLTFIQKFIQCLPNLNELTSIILATPKVLRTNEMRRANET